MVGAVLNISKKTGVFVFGTNFGQILQIFGTNFGYFHASEFRAKLVRGGRFAKRPYCRMWPTL